MTLQEIHAYVAEHPDKFHLIVEDNFHYQEDAYRRLRGSFDTYAEALAAAREIVRASVKECVKQADSRAW